MDIYNYGCSVLATKDVTPATNQLYALRLIVSATVTFHHFDGIAALQRKRELKLLDQEKEVARKDIVEPRVFSLDEVRTLLAMGNIQKNPGPEGEDLDEPPDFLCDVCITLYRLSYLSVF